TRVKTKQLPTLIAVLVLCGCAPDIGNAPIEQKDQKLSQAPAAKKCCESPPAWMPPAGEALTPPAPVLPIPLYSTPLPAGAPLPVAPAGTVTPPVSPFYCPPA